MGDLGRVGKSLTALVELLIRPIDEGDDPSLHERRDDAKALATSIIHRSASILFAPSSLADIAKATQDSRRCLMSIINQS